MHVSRVSFEPREADAFAVEQVRAVGVDFELGGKIHPPSR